MSRVLNESLDDCYWENTYAMLECRGCGSVTLRHHIVCLEEGVDDIKYYPPPISRQMPRWRYDLPSEFQSLMDETYAALHANSKRLALMGARALVDLFMNATIGDIGGFQKKLQKLVETGYLSRKNMEILEPALDAGHAATHRAHNPTADDVTVVFDIVENLIQSLALKPKAEELKKRTPIRQVQPSTVADPLKRR
jgi:Domain of unknown function (DUF4145)